MASLDQLVRIKLHIVAQVVEAELVVGAVGNICGIGLLALLVVQIMKDDAGGKP